MRPRLLSRGKPRGKWPKAGHSAGFNEAATVKSRKELVERDAGTGRDASMRPRLLSRGKVPGIRRLRWRWQSLQ